MKETADMEAALEQDPWAPVSNSIRMGLGLADNTTETKMARVRAAHEIQCNT